MGNVLLKLIEKEPSVAPKAVYVTQIDFEQDGTVAAFCIGTRKEAKPFVLSRDKRAIDAVISVALNHSFDNRDSHFIGAILEAA